MRSRSVHISILALSAGAILTAAAAADTINVPGDAATIQAGINMAMSGDEVVVADGTWTGSGNKNLNFFGKVITVRSEFGAENCIIDCQLNGRAFNFNTFVPNAAVVQGFTIRNGRITNGRGAAISCIGSDPTIRECSFENNRVTGSSWPNGIGGTVLFQSSESILEDSVFIDNEAYGTANNTGFGGGLSIRSSSIVTVTNCTFTENSAAGGTGGLRGYGGGVSVSSSVGTLVNCSFSGNTSKFGGGGLWSGASSDTLLIDCVFDGNASDGHASGIAVSTGEVTVIGGRFLNNQDGGLYSDQDSIGGAAISSYGGGTLYVYNSLFHGNSSTRGGAITNTLNGQAHLINSIFTFNMANKMGSQFGDGGGINTASGADTFIDNCTIAYNTAENSVGGVRVTQSGSITALDNSIVWANDAPALPQIGASAGGVGSSDHSIVEGGAWSGTGNLASDPLFVDADGADDDPATWADNDFQLLTGSPACDSGNNTIVPFDLHDLDDDGVTSEQIPVDFAGEARFVDDPAAADTGSGFPPYVDRGAYEVQPVLCPADVNGDGVVSVPDLVDVILHWGETGGAADVNGDRIVDVQDMVLVITNWGTC